MNRAALANVKAILMAPQAAAVVAPQSRPAALALPVALAVRLPGTMALALELALASAAVMAPVLGLALALRRPQLVTLRRTPAMPLQMPVSTMTPPLALAVHC